MDMSEELSQKPKVNLGYRYNVGETFISATNKMTKNRVAYSRWNVEKNGPLCTYEVLRPGDERFFTKGKRRYFCRVVLIQEMRTGLCHWLHTPNDNISKDHVQSKVRWWQFFYLVRILEN
jgi:hypothetical protein